MSIRQPTLILRLLSITFLVCSLVFSACRPIASESDMQRLVLAATVAQRDANGAPRRSPNPRPVERQVSEAEPVVTPEQVVSAPGEEGSSQTGESRPVIWTRQGVYDPVA